MHKVQCTVSDRQVTARVGNQASSPVILWFDLGLIAREGFSNVSYSKKCALQHTKSLKKFSEGKA